MVAAVVVVDVIVGVGGFGVRGDETAVSSIPFWRLSLIRFSCPSRNGDVAWGQFEEATPVQRRSFFRVLKMR